jgi:thiol-disulfide isomerase/thioredoxin
MKPMKIKIIQLLCLIIILGCQKNDIDVSDIDVNDIEVFNGGDTNLSKLDGGWVVINYWADWCAPCIKEIPELNDFAKENKDIKVYTFNFDQLEIDELEPLAKKFNILVPSLITHPRDIWGIQTPPAVPATFFINPDGELSLSLFRPQTKDDLNKIIVDLKKAF